MVCAIMQPYFLPYLGYFQLINAVDKFVVLDDVNYIKRGWINRNRILINGKDHLFTVPLKNASQNILIKNLKLAIDVKWINAYLKTIEHAYKKAPFFNESFIIIQTIINARIDTIKNMTLKSLLLINEYLGINTKLVNTSSIYNNQELKGQERILDICRKENASVYINPIGGKKLYNKDVFQNNDIELKFLKPLEIKYDQFSHQFIPHLSIIDVLMFNNPEYIIKMLDSYELV